MPHAHGSPPVQSAEPHPSHTHVRPRATLPAQNYLVSLTNVTSIIVSHDSGFLDFVCTNVIHYENRKLRIYRGNISDFVRQKPEVGWGGAWGIMIVGVGVGVGVAWMQVAVVGGSMK